MRKIAPDYQSPAHAWNRGYTCGQIKPMITIRKHAQGIVFKVFVQPRSSTNKIVGIYGDALKISITAAPVGGAANHMCIKFLAKQLAIRPRLLEIISGHTGRTKEILLHADHAQPSEYDLEHFRQKIDDLINT